MKTRIVGIDVARALAVIGMIIVNFKVVFGTEGSPWLKTLASIFDGKAAATFVVLAGLGIALLTKKARESKDTLKLALARKRILKRAFFLFVLGISYYLIWPADILHFYGLYLLLVLLFLKQRGKVIMGAALALIIAFPILLSFIDYEQGWDFSTLNYLDFWTLEGFARNLFVNGFHPVIPWAAFILVGYWFGQQDLQNPAYLKRMLLGSGLLFFGLQLFSVFSIRILADGDSSATEGLSQILGTSPMPPLPIYMFSGMAIALLVISACILWGYKQSDSKLILALNRTGQLALTFYVAHVIIGMGLVELFLPEQIGQLSIDFSFSYALIFSVLCVIFAWFWRQHFSMGPLEALMRKLTD
tara:strand:+ start:115829 stop:116905 length:1077 start_codon:yes stop_codon:yes gene_type:complete